MTSAAVALGEERPVVRDQPLVERASVESFEVPDRGGLWAKAALGTIALVEAGWLATLGYVALLILR